MKRYWLFMYSDYYPNGGMADFVKSFDKIQDAEDYVMEESNELLFHIFDSINESIIRGNDNLYLNSMTHKIEKIN